VVERHQIPAERVDDLAAGFDAHEHPAEVVPCPVGVDAAVHEPIEGAVGDSAQVERRRSQRTELGPAEMAFGKPRQPNHGVPELVDLTDLDRSAIATRSTATVGLVAAP
jgi:hypothetical protein